MQAKRDRYLQAASYAWHGSLDLPEEPRVTNCTDCTDSRCPSLVHHERWGTGTRKAENSTSDSKTDCDEV